MDPLSQQLLHYEKRSEPLKFWEFDRADVGVVYNYDYFSTIESKRMSIELPSLISRRPT